VALGFASVKRFELSEHTVYQLFTRQIGLRSEYVELILSRDLGELRQVLATTGGELLHTVLPKLTRFLIVDDVENTDAAADFGDHRIIGYDRFLDTIVDVPAHLSRITTGYPELPARPAIIGADLLSTDENTGEYAVHQVGDAVHLLEQLTGSGGNALVVGRTGSGKTTLLKQLVAAGRNSADRRYRFYFDLSSKYREESFADFVTRILAPIMGVERARIVDCFRYLARTGSVVCALDAIDEAVGDTTQAGFLALFTELAEILSADSIVVMSSRTSFLEDSPPVRRLLDGTLSAIPTMSGPPTPPCCSASSRYPPVSR
jgi:hypothetical protein